MWSCVRNGVEWVLCTAKFWKIIFSLNSPFMSLLHLFPPAMLFLLMFTNVVLVCETFCLCSFVC